ncbi:MAG: epoxyqueuosine reductase QueH [Candidatus Coatesbacteria bacterium]|nr:epoxyqueuosine reductase QueH [Candidatus Coatesbacteria bacterium]
MSDKKKEVFLHVCCAPCLLGPLSDLRAKEINVTGFFFNPNIHPLMEFLKRRNTLREASRILDFHVCEESSHDYLDFLRNTVSDVEQRCSYCYSVRIRYTALTAKNKGFSSFSTTLLYSKYQKHDLIKSIAERISDELEISFHYEDWREYWKWGIEESKRMDLYRQNYCGCIYSEFERFKNKLAK